jgi:hypothetical protein
VRIAPAGVLALLCSCAAPAGSPEEGWKPLFNGRDLEGWVSVGSAVWRVENGEIAGGQDGDPRRSGVLATKELYQDFELSLEFLIDEHGKYNSGVYLRNDPGSASQAAYQVNIGRAAAGEYCGGIVIQKKRGIEWLSKGDETDAIRKPLAWNTLRILAKGPHLVVDLNGVKIADVVDPAPPPRSLQKGVIALQTYGAEGHAGFVKFRHLRIREL